MPAATGEPLKVLKLPSRVLVVGASGLIGSTVAARLASRGVDVTGLARGRRTPSASHWITADMAKLIRAEDWLPILKDQDAVVNCAGILQGTPTESTASVHVEGAAALFAACERAGVRRVVHISAIGVDRATPTEFSRTKLVGDENLQSRNLDWVILRPSVVVGAPAYGGSALFRGLAALPVLPEVPGAGAIQVVQLDDLAETVLFFLEPDAPARLALDVAGPQRLSVTEVVLAYRRWLGWNPPRVVRVPLVLAKLIYRMGDLVGLLGWRTPLRSTALREVTRGAVGDPARWRELTKIEPSSLAEALARSPASVQEKWFARLYFLKPIVLGVLSVFWIATGLVTLGPGWAAGLALLREAGLAQLAPLALVSGALADIVIGIGIAYRPTARLALWAALCLSLIYLIIGSVLLPDLWADPLGPMLKILPIMVLNLVALAILGDR